MPRLAFAVVAVFLLAGAALAAPRADLAPRLDDGRLLVAQAAMGNFYLYEFERQSGPFSAEELIEQISIGNIGKSAYVWQPGMDDWAPIESIPEFAAAFPPDIELPRPYYVIDNGVRVGPLTESEMQIRIIELQSGPDDLAWKAGLADWTPLSQFSEFADQLAAAQVPDLPPGPGKQEPPPLPGEEHAGGTEADLDAAEMAALWSKLESVLTRQVPVVVATATSKEQQQIIACLSELLRPADPAVWQLLIDAELQPDEAQAALLDKLDPSLTAAAQACVEEATAMKDMLDAMLFGAADEAFTGAPSELLLEAYKCLRESVEAVSPEHRQQVMDATDRLDDTAIGILDRHYPGFAATVQGCLIADIAPHDDSSDNGTILVPPVDGGGAGDEATTGPEEPDRPIDDGSAPPAADAFMEAIKRSLAQGGLPAYLVATTAPCFAGRLERVITPAEREAIIAEGLTDALSQQLEAAHPGLGESLASCVPRNMF